MFIPLITLKLFALLLIGCLIGCLLIIVVFGPEAYRFARKELAGGWPFDKPGWWYRIRKTAREATAWLRSRGAEAESYLILILVFLMLWLGLVISAPL